MDLLLPFKVGDIAEYKTFLKGYRGAWFRCKIHDMRVHESDGYLEYYLEYIDYTEEEKEWVRVFQKNPKHSNKYSTESPEIMIRPSFPQWYYGHEVPEQFPNSDVTAVVDETWKVGDLVDWWTKGCYWSGTITRLFNKDIVKIELLAPPIGEGKRYLANCKDLRPTLEWSLTKGWAVPLSQANRNSRHAARLLPHSQSGSEKSTSCEDSSSDDEYSENKGGVQQSVCSASKMRQESPGPVVLKPSKAMDNLKPSSTSKSADPSHGTQSTPTYSQHAGIGVIQQELDTAVSIMEAHEWFLKEPEADDDVPDEFKEKLDEFEEKLYAFEEKLDTLQARLNYLVERARVAHDRCAEVLARLGSPEDHPSGK